MYQDVVKAPVFGLLAGHLFARLSFPRWLACEKCVDDCQVFLRSENVLVTARFSSAANVNGRMPFSLWVSLPYPTKVQSSHRPPPSPLFSVRALASITGIRSSVSTSATETTKCFPELDVIRGGCCFSWSVPNYEGRNDSVPDKYSRLQHPRTDVLRDSVFWIYLAGDRLLGGKVDSRHSRFIPVIIAVTVAIGDAPSGRRLGGSSCIAAGLL